MPGWVKGVLIGCGGLVLVAGIGMVGCLVWLGSTPEGGVKLPHEMDDYALEYIEEHGLLEEGEELRAYYDETMVMDGSVAAIVTDRRVMRHADGRTTAIALSDIAEIDHRDEGLVGDVIEVVASNGEALRLEVAPMNDGMALLRALERAREAVQGAEEQSSGTE